MKARFVTEQLPVRWRPLDNGLVDVTICLNGQELTEESFYTGEEGKGGTTGTYIEYDFNQFREKKENINRADVEKNPGEYLDYKPKSEKTLDERIREQDETIRMLAECLLEMSELVYA